MIFDYPFLFHVHVRKQEWHNKEKIMIFISKGF